MHGNSGVPNHAYALAVDGGSYNGQTITGMGLDQAAAIWYRAGLSYLTPSSNFSEFATALETSCTDLVGAPITKLTTETAATPDAGDPGDRGQLHRARQGDHRRRAPHAGDPVQLHAGSRPGQPGPLR